MYLTSVFSPPKTTSSTAPQPPWFQTAADSPSGGTDRGGQGGDAQDAALWRDRATGVGGSLVVVCRFGFSWDAGQDDSQDQNMCM